MKNLNKNSFAWFIGAIFFGGVAVGSGYAIEFIIFLLAIILSKQIEIISQQKD